MICEFEVGELGDDTFMRGEERGCGAGDEVAYEFGFAVVDWG